MGRRGHGRGRVCSSQLRRVLLPSSWVSRIYFHKIIACGLIIVFVIPKFHLALHIQYKFNNHYIRSIPIHYCTVISTSGRYCRCHFHYRLFLRCNIQFRSLLCVSFLHPVISYFAIASFFSGERIFIKQRETL